MPTAIVTQSNGQITKVLLVPSEGTEDTVVDAVPAEGTEDTVPEAQVMASTGAVAENTSATTTVPDKGPNPIAAEPKEILWPAGAFFVLLVVMRYVLFPKLKKGMDQRYASIRSNVEGAEQVKSNARADVASYEAAVAAVKVEAAARIDAARQTLDNERTARLAEVNARIASARADADSANNAARSAGQAQVETAVATVVAQAAELATGTRPDAAVVAQTVKQVMESAGSR
jgi:F-type H+-transporting ATPase subunit b